MKIILYTTHCPKCSILEKKLKAKNIDYIENEDVSIMSSLGIEAVPVLSIDGALLNYSDANKWINEYK